MSVSAVNQEYSDLYESERDPRGSSAVKGVAGNGSLIRHLAFRALGGVREGQFALATPEAQFLIGHPAADLKVPTVIVNSDRFYKRLVWEGSLGAAAAYLDGDWECDDLTELLRIFARQLERQPAVLSPLASISQAMSRVGHWLARNTRRGSRKNIEAHYDLGDDFFRLFLDPTMMYSSAIFESESLSLEQAQLARLERICSKLALKTSDHLLEIGTGWGGLAVHAARRIGCRVTTTTISENQYLHARQKVRAAGLEDRVTVLKQDYRDLRGRYDKVVSIEMVEAVGHQFHDTFFRQIARLLAPEGKMLLQAIVIPEQRYERYLKSVDFIQKYIFPGGSLPSLSALQSAVTRTSRMRLLEVNDFAEDYARTLREWRSRFWERIDDVRELGYSERFIRMWHYYLCYCEAGFRERAVGVVQAVWGR
jgi:cyclopropane-fatty-acyl-phospholipid synthase